MAICQGLGLALAVGIGGPLAALFVAMMAALGSGIHPDLTDYDFLGATWFLVTLLAVSPFMPGSVLVTCSVTCGGTLTAIGLPS